MTKDERTRRGSRLPTQTKGEDPRPKAKTQDPRQDQDEGVQNLGEAVLIPTKFRVVGRIEIDLWGGGGDGGQAQDQRRKTNDERRKAKNKIKTQD
jgi:hypothetical protein